MDQNIDSSSFNQIQPLQYPAIHHPSQEINEEVLQDREKFIKDIKTFLEKFSRISFGVMPKVLSIAWERFSKINHAYIYKRYQPEKIQELMCKLREDVRNKREELSEYINSPSWNYPTFYDDEEYSVQYKEYLEKYSNAIAPVLSTKEPEYSLSMGEYKVTSEDKRECDVLVCEDSSTFDVCEDHSEILSDSNDDDISSDDDAFEDIGYVEATPLDSELVSLEEENDVYQEEEEFNLEDIQDVILCEKLLSINRLITNIESLNDNPTPDRMLNYSASFPIFEKSDNSLSISDNSSPEFETFSDHTKETRSGSTTTHANNSLPENIDDNSEGDIHFLEELLSDDSIPFLENESFNSDHQDDPLFPRPPPEPPDVEFFFDVEPNLGEVISVVMDNIDELNEDECFPRRSEDTIFDPAMAFEQRSSKPRLQSMTSGQISSGLDLTYAPSTITSQQPTEGELDLLFEAMYDDYIGGQLSATARTILAAQEPQVRQTLTTSTTIADTAPTPTNSLHKRKG
nr:hypothetical protein [Tanacetum cinerariifolium]